MTAQASAQLDARIHDFVMPRDEVNENTRGLYPCLWEIKNRRHDAVLNSLPEMPMSPSQLMKTQGNVEDPVSVEKPGNVTLRAVTPLCDKFSKTWSWPQKARRDENSCSSFEIFASLENSVG